MPPVTPPDSDCLRIDGLRAETRLGVPEQERARPQGVKINLVLFPAGPLQGLGDDFSRTVDYAAVAERIRAVAAAGERSLVETLAEEIGEMLLREFPLRRVEVEVLKFVLPDTDAVGVRIAKNR
ncbi:MAG: dihydroneopterin aldolase [Verrucomicrobiales bacterium]|nr:dihydroneopterin aldolase [Verrucomicrobiales bacterium]